MTKDLTDDIYEKITDANMFVPDDSEMFVNLLVVVPNVKLDEFKSNYWNLVNAHYQQNDSIDEAKIPEIVKNKYKAMKEA
jgi:hypothetical protein